MFSDFLNISITVLLISIFSISYLGFGIFFKNVVLGKKLKLNLGEIGLIGVFFLIIISYLTIFFVSHNSLHNVFILSVGVLFFFFNLKNFDKNQLKLFFILVILTISFFIISKNHDDFPYYHLPYALYLSENKITFGMGLLNYGYRHHSSVLFLNSLKFIPIFKYYLFNLPNYLILTFVNFILIQYIIQNINRRNLIFLLSLIFFLLINLKFNRLAEYGTDLGGQILLSIIFLNLISNILNKENIEKVYFNLILLFIIFSFKVYFILYFAIIPITLYFLKLNPFLRKNFNMKLFITFLIFGGLFFSHNIINTGCFIYPISVTCFGEYFSWALSINEVQRMDLWLEVWAKAGASPNFKVDNFESYVGGFNWVQNWANNYFFNKGSDYVLTVFFINLIIFLFYKREIKFHAEEFSLIKKILIPITIFILFVWFLKHPSLRYGGYIPLGFIIIFIMIFFYNNKSKKKSKNDIYTKTKVFVLFALLFFNIKNIARINFELNREDQYKFTNFPFFSVKDKDYKKFKLDNNNHIYVTDGYCWATPTPCTNTRRSGYSINGYLFLKR